MSDQTTLFDNEQGAQTTSGISNLQNSQITDATVANLLSSIKNENGGQKYKSLEEALKALQHSQTYIPELKAKLTEQEQKLNEANVVATQVTELRSVIENLTSNRQQLEGKQYSQSMSEDEIAELVTKTLSRTQQVELAKKNVQEVADAVKAAHGDAAKEKYEQRARELGMTPSELDALSAKTPKAVLEMLGIKNEQRQQSFNPDPSLNSAAFTQSQQSTTVGRNKTAALVGATTADLMAESKAAKQMVDEIHAKGMTVYDLTDPKVYFKQFA